MRTPILIWVVFGVVMIPACSPPGETATTEEHQPDGDVAAGDSADDSTDTPGDTDESGDAHEPADTTIGDDGSMEAGVTSSLTDLELHLMDALATMGYDEVGRLNEPGPDSANVVAYFDHGSALHLGAYRPDNDGSSFRVAGERDLDGGIVERIERHEHEPMERFDCADGYRYYVEPIDGMAPNHNTVEAITNDLVEILACEILRGGG